MAVVILGLIVVGLLLVLLLRSKTQAAKPIKQKTTAKRVNSSHRGAKTVSPKGSPISSSAASDDYRSVTVTARLGACEAAIALKDRVFLAREAPSLPLNGCDVANCACRYLYLEDRRQEDRRSPYGLKHGAVVGGTEGNRRDPGNRRQ